MKKIIVINYRNLDVGGIENYINDVVNVALKEDYEIWWLCDINPVISPIYKVFHNKTIKKIYCNTHSIHWFYHKNITFHDAKKIIILSFSFFDHLRALELLKSLKCKEKIPLFIMPHFTGGLLFPETNFKLFRPMIRKLVANFYHKFIYSGEMMFMAKNHPVAIENAYNFSIDESLKILAPEFREIRAFDENRILSNYERNSFYIVSAGRLEFPHKGYLLGLIDVFEELKTKYPFLMLFIIGDGKDKKILFDKLKKLPINIQKDIIYHKSMPFEKLLDFYQKCNLSISVAGCASAGARIGLLTLPARHYTERCEVYGFIPESKYMTTSDKPGMPVKPFIEKVINMDKNEYIKMSKASYRCYNNNIATISALCNTRKNTYFPTFGEMLLIKTIYILEKVNYFLKLF